MLYPFLYPKEILAEADVLHFHLFQFRFEAGSQFIKLLMKNVNEYLPHLAIAA